MWDRLSLAALAAGMVYPVTVGMERALCSPNTGEPFSSILLPRMLFVLPGTLRAAVSFESTWASYTTCRVGCPWAQARRLLLLSPGEHW